MPSIKQELRKFIVDNFLFSDCNGELADSDSFLEKGIIDSTGMLELVNFVQERHGIMVEDAELIPDNLDSIDKLKHFIQRKLTAAANNRVYLSQ